MYEDIRKNKVRTGVIVSIFLIVIALIVYYICIAFDLGIVSIVIASLLLRHINVLLAGLVTLILAIVLIFSIPLIPKFKIEQEDSLEKMLFYAIIVLGMIVIFLYWGGTLV